MYVRSLWEMEPLYVLMERTGWFMLNQLAQSNLTHICLTHATHHGFCHGIVSPRDWHFPEKRRCWLAMAGGIFASQAIQVMINRTIHYLHSTILLH